MTFLSDLLERRLERRINGRVIDNGAHALLLEYATALVNKVLLLLGDRESRDWDELERAYLELSSAVGALGEVVEARRQKAKEVPS